MNKEEKSNIYDDTTYTESNRNNNRIIWEVMHTLWHIRDVKINLHMVSTRLPPRIFITKVFSITSIIFENTFYCYTITILHQSDKKFHNSYIMVCIFRVFVIVSILLWLFPNNVILNSLLIRKFRNSKCHFEDCFSFNVKTIKDQHFIHCS